MKPVEYRRYHEPPTAGATMNAVVALLTALSLMSRAPRST